MLEIKEIIELVEEAIREGAVGARQVMGAVIRKGRGNIDTADALRVVRAYCQSGCQKKTEPITHYHLLTDEEFLGTTMSFGTAWGNIYKCPCGQLNSIDHHVPIRGWLEEAMRCSKCGCILAFHPGDVKFVVEGIKTTEDKIAFPREHEQKENALTGVK